MPDVNNKQSFLECWINIKCTERQTFSMREKTMESNNADSRTERPYNRLNSSFIFRHHESDLLKFKSVVYEQFNL